MSEHSQHTRKPVYKERLIVDDAHLLEMSFDELLNTNAKLQARLASALVTFLKYNVTSEEIPGFGPGCAAWRDGKHLMLSCLPSASATQVTFEFELWPNHLVLNALLVTTDLRFARISSDEWEPAIAGRVSVEEPLVDIEREASLFALKHRGAPLGYPLSSHGSEAVHLCEWISGPLNNDYLEWGRDPRLNSSGPALTQNYYYKPSQIAVAIVLIQGGWPKRAMLAYKEALAELLPNRYSFRVLKYGKIRICIYLGSDCRDEAEARFYAFSSIDYSEAATLRGHAALEFMEMDPPRLDYYRVWEPQDLEVNAFDAACASLGDEAVPRTSYGSDWTSLDEAPLTNLPNRLYGRFQSSHRPGTRPWLKSAIKWREESRPGWHLPY